MTVNMGSADKIVRLVIGIGLISWGFYAKSWWGAIGVIPIVTAFLNWCPLYTACGASTCAPKKSSATGT